MDYHRGRRAYRQFTRATDPVDPNTLSQKELLALLGVHHRSASALMLHSQGNLFTLQHLTVRELTRLAGVGQHSARRAAAILGLCQHYVRRGSFNQEGALETLMGRLEARGLLEHAEGDLWNLVGRDHEELLAADLVGTATVAKVMAVFSFVSRYVSQHPASVAA